MSTTTTETLQLRALEERGQLHRTAAALREKVTRTREKLRFSKHAHDHLFTVSLVAGLIGLVSGYGVAGLFTVR